VRGGERAMSPKYLEEVYAYACYNQAGKPLINARSDRIRTIISASQARQDGKAEDLEALLEADEQLVIQCHKDCVSSYTSKTNINRILKRSGMLISGGDVEASTSKRHRRCATATFHFKEHCLFCGETCVLNRDPKHPDRWRPAYSCRTAERREQHTFTQTILDVCNARQDDIGQTVKMRVLSVVSDLHAADARYHDDCRKRFMVSRSVGAASRAKEADELEEAVSATVQQSAISKVEKRL